MCGIAGFCLLNNSNFLSDPKKILFKIMNSVAHRGPDSKGSWISKDNKVFIGHQRLSILDLSTNANQPITSHSKNWTISFNGEIYNYKELLNMHFPTEKNISSDTVILVKLIEKFGFSSAIHLLEGMFSIVAYKVNENKIYFVRDRLGEKPLFYYRDKNILAFGSEIKVLTSIPGINLSLSNQSILNYFTFNYISRGQTIYSEIKKVNPGEIIEFDLNSLSIFNKNYWKLDQKKNLIKNLEFKKIVDDTESCLIEIIKKEMISDVPIGCFLSSGIDSSLITSIASSKVNNLKTFTLKNSSFDFDESSQAEQISKYLRTDHYTLTISNDDLLNAVNRINDVYDEPFADSSQIPTFLISKLARKHVKVALSGDGGDEFFGGYTRYVYFLKLWPIVSKMPSFIKLNSLKLKNLLSVQTINNFFYYLSKLTFGYISFYNSAYSINKFLNLIQKNSLSESFYYLITNDFNKKEFFSKNFLNLVNTDNISYVENINSINLHDINNYLPDDILTKVDRASMSNSLEVRCPFLNHKLVELSMQIPISLKIKNFKSKVILRKILQKYIPAKLISNKKRGFSVPIAEWLRNEFFSELVFFSSKKYLQDQGIFNHEYINNVLNNFKKKNSSAEKFLWSFLIFQKWFFKNK